MIIHIVIPIFAIILCGYLANRFSILSKSSSNVLNDFVYYFALPAILFFSISTAPVDKISNIQFFIANGIIILGGFFFAFFLFAIFLKKKLPEISLYSMAASYGNTGFLGIPLMIAAFGQEAAVPAAITTFMYDLLIITIVTLFYETWKNKSNANHSSSIKTLSKILFVNPVNISIILGILFAFGKIELPQSIQVFTETLGNAAGPTALFALGLGLVREKVDVPKLNVRDVSIILGMKLIIQPLIAIILVTYVFHFDELWAIALVILSALPTGAMANVFANRYQSLHHQMPTWILFTTVTSLLTLTIFLVLLVG